MLLQVLLQSSVLQQQDLRHVAVQFKISKVFFQHLLSLFSLKSWHLNCTQFLIHTTYTLCLYLWRSAKATETVFKIYTSICMLFDDINDMQSNSSTNKFFMNFNFTWVQWTSVPRVRTQDTSCESSRQHSPALEITVQHPYLLPAWEPTTLSEKCIFFIHMRFSFNLKKFIFKLITCSIFDHSWSYLNHTLVSFDKLLLLFPIPLRLGLTAHRRGIFQERLFHFLHSPARPSNFLLLAAIIVKLCSISRFHIYMVMVSVTKNPKILWETFYWVTVIVIIVPNSPLLPHLYSHWNLIQSACKTLSEQHDKLVHI